MRKCWAKELEYSEKLIHTFGRGIISEDRDKLAQAILKQYIRKSEVVKKIATLYLADDCPSCYANKKILEGLLQMLHRS